jgi:hypothetical protein
MYIPANYTPDAVAISSLLIELTERHNFSVTISRKKRREGGTYSIEIAYLSDGGSNYQDGFPTLLAALCWAAKEQDEDDDRRLADK